MGFFQTFTEVRGPLGLATLPAVVHPETPLLYHKADRGAPISLPRGMYEEEKESAIQYGTYASANNEVEFINADLVEQVQA